MTRLNRSTASHSTFDHDPAIISDLATGHDFSPNRVRRRRVGFRRFGIGLLNWVEHDPYHLTRFKIPASAEEATIPAGAATNPLFAGGHGVVHTDPTPDLELAPLIHLARGHHLECLVVGGPATGGRIDHRGLGFGFGFGLGFGFGFGLRLTLTL